MYKLIIVLICFLIFSCKTHNINKNKFCLIKADTSVFKTNIFWQDQVPDLNFYYSSLKGFINNSFILKENEPTKLYINEPSLIFSVKDQYYNIILPYDTILIKISSNDGSFEFSSSNNSMRNNELSYTAKILSTLKEIYLNQYKHNLFINYTIDSILMYESECKKNIVIREAKQKKALDSLCKIYNVPDETKKDFEIYIMLASTNNLAYLYTEFYDTLVHHNKIKERLKELCIKFDNLKYTSNISCYKTESILNNILALLLGTPKYSVPQSHISQNNIAQLFETTLTNFKGLARDYLLSSIMFYAIKKKVNIPKKYAKQYFKVCVSKEYKKIIKDLIKNRKKLIKTTNKNGVDVLRNKDGKYIENIEKVIANNRGKIILLDFWATWCAPCLEELPSLKKLSQQYSANEFIIISLSFDKIFSSWQRFIYTENYNLENNYIINEYDKSSFSLKYQINEIPRFILIDKNGKVIDENAPRPSELRLKKIIDSCINL